jgi:hypothetical protein
MTWWNFYFQVFEKAITKEEVVEFLMHLLQHLSGPLLIVWMAASPTVVSFSMDVPGFLPRHAPSRNTADRQARRAQDLAAGDRKRGVLMGALRPFCGFFDWFFTGFDWHPD